MYQQQSSTGRLTPVVKNLIIINALAFFAYWLFERGFSFGGAYIREDLNSILGLYTPGSKHFYIFQYVSYMFMHGSFSHLFFNMFALFMFGSILERVWGERRFLFYYFATGIGAGLVNVLVSFIRVKFLSANIPPELFAEVYESGRQALLSGQNFSNPTLATINYLLNIPMVGASGAIFGLLLAFGMMFPDERIYVYFLLPIKAKWFVIIYGAIEFFSVVFTQYGDNVAHLAHLGGMLFGYFLIKYWRKH